MQFDIGHTILDSYREVGLGAIEVEKQHVRSKKIRAGFAAVEDLSNEKYDIKRHGKIEYVADIDRASNFKYTYIGDSNKSFTSRTVVLPLPGQAIILALFQQSIIFRRSLVLSSKVFSGKPSSLQADSNLITFNDK